MGIDLNLANRIWQATWKQAQALGHDPHNLDYGTAVAVVLTLFSNKALAEEVVQEVYEPDALAGSDSGETAT